MNQKFEYNGPVFVKPGYPSVVLGAEDDAQAPRFEHLMKTMLGPDAEGVYTMELSIKIKRTKGK